MRKGNVASAHGAPKLIADAVATARRCGAGELVTVRADSAYYQRPVVAAVRTAGARFSITARTNPQITKAITGIDPDAWPAIKYPRAVFDAQAGGWISDAAVAEVGFTAFTSRPKAEQVTARLIVRRVKRLKPAAPTGPLLDTTSRGQHNLQHRGRVATSAGTHRVVDTHQPLGQLKTARRHSYRKPNSLPSGRLVRGTGADKTLWKAGSAPADSRFCCDRMSTPGTERMMKCRFSSTCW